MPALPGAEWRLAARAGVGFGLGGIFLICAKNADAAAAAVT